MTATRLLSPAALVLLATSLTSADEKLTLPQSHPPQPAVAAYESDGILKLRMLVAGEPPGKRSSPAEKPSQRLREETYRLEPEEIRFYDHTGKELDAKAVRAQLSKETLVLYYFGHKPDPLHFRTIKEGLLLVVYVPVKVTKPEPRRPVPGLAELLKKQGYVAVPLVQVADRLGVPVKAKGKEILLGLDTGASHVSFDKARVSGPDFEWDNANTCPIDKLEVAGIQVGPLRAHFFDMTQTNAWMEAAGERLIDGLLGAEVLRPLSAVIDHSGATLYLKKPEPKK